MESPFSLKRGEGDFKEKTDWVETFLPNPSIEPVLIAWRNEGGLYGDTMVVVHLRILRMKTSFAFCAFNFRLSYFVFRPASFGMTGLSSTGIGRFASYVPFLYGPLPQLISLPPFYPARFSRAVYNHPGKLFFDEPRISVLLPSFEDTNCPKISPTYALTVAKIRLFFHLYPLFLPSHQLFLMFCIFLDKISTDTLLNIMSTAIIELTDLVSVPCYNPRIPKTS